MNFKLQLNRPPELAEDPPSSEQFVPKLSDQCGCRGSNCNVINNLVAICRDKKRQKATKGTKRRRFAAIGRQRERRKAGAGHSRTRLRDSGWFFLSSGKLHSAFSEDAKENQP
jgi:hypothetical protein